MKTRQTKFARRDVNGHGPHAAPTGRCNATSLLIPWGVQQLSWRCLAVGKNCRNRRRKLIDARAGHDDAVAAAVSFLGDTQEPASLIFSELDIKVLALNLEFSRLDDVIHFCLKGADFGRWRSEMEAKSAPFKGISYPSPCWAKPRYLMFLERPSRFQGRVAVLPAHPRLWCALILHH